MSKIISGKEAKSAWASGVEIQLKEVGSDFWDSEINVYTCSVFDDSEFEFRLKPRTISLNGFDVPVPFEPKAGDDCRCYYINTSNKIGYDWYHSSHHIAGKIAWRTEEEVQQVFAVVVGVFLNDI